MPYSTAATCLHIDAQSGQLQVKRTSFGDGNSPVFSSHSRVMTPFDHDRRYPAALLLELRQFARGLSPSSTDRDVGLEAVVVAVIHLHSMDAVWRSSATSFNRSSSLISVNSTSPPPSSRSWDSW